MVKYGYIKIRSKTSMKKWYESKGFSQEFYEDNVKDIEIWEQRFFYHSSCRDSINTFLNNIVDCKIFKLGSLQFRFTKLEDDPLFLNIHIREGVDISTEACNKSYDMACLFYKELGFDFDRVKFLCSSWIFDDNLQKYLPNNSKIVQLQNSYKMVNKGEEVTREVIRRVFDIYDDSQIDLSKLPENTSLQKKLKMALINKEKFYFCTVEKDYNFDENRAIMAIANKR